MRCKETYATAASASIARQDGIAHREDSQRTLEGVATLVHELETAET